MLKNLERTANIIAPCQPANLSIETGTSVIVERKKMSPVEPTCQYFSEPPSRNNCFETIKPLYSKPQTKIDSDNLHPPIVKHNSDMVFRNCDFEGEDRYPKSVRMKVDKSESNINDDEEIDVVRVDDSCDPMWRPW